MIDLVDIDGLTIMDGVWYWAWNGTHVVGAGKFTPDGTFWINGSGYAGNLFEYAAASVRDFDVYLDHKGFVHRRQNRQTIPGDKEDHR